MVKCLPTMWETWVRSLGWEDPLEKEMATHSSTFAWKIPWMEKPGKLQFTGLQRVGHDWVTSLSLLCRTASDSVRIVCVCVCVCVCAHARARSVSQSCPTLCNPWTAACQDPLPICFQARILECVAISYSRVSSWPKDWTLVPYIGRQILHHWATWEAKNLQSSRNVCCV